MNTWIAVIGTLLGATIGGGIAFLNSYFQLQTQLKRDRQRVLLSRLEEIYELLWRIRKAYTLSSLEMVGKLSGTELADKLEADTVVPIERLELLIGFYAPTLFDLLQKLEEHRNTFGELVLKSILWDKRDANVRTQIMQSLGPELQNLGNLCVQMQKEVLLLSKDQF
jgi:hypothetical protein